MTKTALVTGANRGIGLEVCRGLAREGFRVLLAARQLSLGERAATELRSTPERRSAPERRSPGADVTAVLLDVGSEASIASLAERAGRDGWRIDALINNAGVSLRGFDAEKATATLATNFFGPMRMCDALRSFLVEGAKVVNVSSGMGELRVLGPQLRKQFEGVSDRRRLLELAAEFVNDVRAGRHSERGWPSNAYSVSKVALNAFTRIYAAEQPDLRVNAMCPGWVRTDMGGSSAPRSVVEGASGIIWAATLPASGPTGGFFRDTRRISW